MMTRRAWLGIAGAVALAARARGVARADASPRVAAHRGGAALWPENSLLAFRNALVLGVDFLETDVHLTADGELIVMHDPTLDRTSTGRGPIASARLGDLATVRLKEADGRVTDEPVPTLAQLLDLLVPSPSGLLLEIKVGVDRQRYPGIEEKALALVDARGLAARTVVMGFERETVRRARELRPAIRTTFLVGRGAFSRGQARPEDAVRWTVDLGATYLGIDHRALSAPVVAAARKAGIKVNAWTVDDEGDIRRVVDLGVDVVTSNRPDLAKRIAGR